MKTARMLCLPLLMIVMLMICASASGDKTVLFTFTGDCTIGGTELTRNLPDSFDTFIANEGYDYPFRYFRDMFSRDDCTVINLEGVLSDSRSDESMGKTFRFRGKTDFVKILTGASVDVAGLANNHILDFGVQGINNTKKTLTENGIGWAYARDIYIWEKDGIRIAIVSLDEATSNQYYYKIKDQMLRLKAQKETDAIIVLFHSAMEYRPVHSSLQERMGSKFIVDCGADLVIMNHAHVVQGIRQVNNRTVCYCLGNFVFGGNNEIKNKNFGGHATTSRYTLVVQACLTFADDSTYLGQQVTLYPVFVTDDPRWNKYQPFPVSGEDAAAVMDAVQYDTDFTLPEITEKNGYAVVELPYLSAGSSEGDA